MRNLICGPLREVAASTASARRIPLRGGRKSGAIAPPCPMTGGIHTCGGPVGLEGKLSPRR
jgi:hypothetical protein